MFLKISRFKHREKEYVNASIVEGYRDKDKRVKHRTVLNLGPVRNEEDKERYRRMLEDFKKGEQWLKPKDLNFVNQTDFGLLYFSRKVLERLDLTEKIEKILKDTRIKNPMKVFFGLVANRFSEPWSDLSFTKWFEKNTKEKVSEQGIYRFLTYLYSKKEEIENEVFKTLKLKNFFKTRIVFYDLTSSYFESSISEIVQYGYSRDKRKDKKQIVIGVILLDDLPIASYIFEGNTQDKQTLEKIVKNTKERFGVEDFIVVADRGLISNDNIELIENDKLSYILATKRRLLNQEEKEFFIKGKNLEEKTIKKRRYLVIINQEKRAEELERLEKLYQKINGLLSSKKSLKTIFKELGKACRIIDLEKKRINEKAFEYEKSIAGKYMLVTNTFLPKKELIYQYKRLQEIERFFRELKSFVKVRPAWHRKKENIISHVFICVFALLVKRLLEKLCKGSFEVLKEVKAAQITINNNSFFLLNEAYQQHQETFKKLNLPLLPKLLPISVLN